jgi:hypothetical protein
MAVHAPVDVVVTSPLRRAYSTALAIAHAQGLQPVEVPGLEDSSTRVFTYTFETGGKPQRENDGIWARITNRVTNTLRITNPPHYAVVQFQPAKPQEAVAGEPPPVPVPDPDAQVISAVLVRDIGQRRLPAALLTMGSALIFGLLCAMLHVRDRRVAEHRSASVPATTGG